ncbi:hypothetical protein CHS0354_041628 [Potamilus streckersoni]|uniref:PPM-type phosphatase domain-containing protein n=1 Tax=Potamilus streckersoni TaxID=2493646 RepID=A0AAE0SDI3_9BIVA|nr:hypothetical protein CHS0354_041628 [Potamilus streckersoni]
MDLFGDLPEPSSKNGSSLSLYDDLNEKKDCSGNVSTKGDNSTFNHSNDASQEREQRSQERGEKRKFVAAGEAEAIENTVKKKIEAVYKLKGYFAERKGERDEMQDAHLIIDDFTPEFKNLHPTIHRLSVFGVFDGHAGSRASRFASQNLHKYLRDKFVQGDVHQVEREIKRILTDAFKKTDEDFLKEASKYKPVWKDGTTAILIIVINDTAYIANLGDSMAVLCRYKTDSGGCVPVPLSTAHNPSLYEERMRIQKAGGHVKDGRVMGVLEVSRSIGDGQYKKHGVTCFPDVKRCQLTDDDRFIVIACDGLWKCFSNEESIKVVNDILQVIYFFK